jgi:hypothetical protein
MGYLHVIRHYGAGTYAPQQKPRQYLTIAVFSTSVLAWVFILWAGGAFG